MKVALVITSQDLSNKHLLDNVITVHFTMLLKALISVRTLVLGNRPQADRNRIFLDKVNEWVIIPNLHQGNQVNLDICSNSVGQVSADFFKQVDVISDRLRDNLFDVDICILYDILYLERNSVYNLAIRKAQESLPNLRFIAYTHSLPKKRPIMLDRMLSTAYTPMPNTLYVTPNHSETLALARQFNLPEGKCRVVHTCLDILSPMHEAVKAIANKIALLSPDILIIYPARLTPGKKFDKVITFAAAIKNRTERSVKVVFCDFPSIDINPDLYKALIKRLGRALNLSDDEILFTSDVGYNNGFPRSGVLDLFALSNLFVCPSFSESFGLIALEAASRGNFLVLNEKVPALAELGLQLHAYFMRWDAKNFGYDTKETYYPSEQDYLQEHAEKVLNLMEGNPVVHAKALTRRCYSPQWVWENQFSPLLETT